MKDESDKPSDSSFILPPSSFPERGHPMSRATDTAVIGVFTDRAKAQAAYEELKRAGFQDEQIGYVGRNGPGPEEGDVLAHAVEGVAVGGIGGGALGAA